MENIKIENAMYAFMGMETPKSFVNMVKKNMAKVKKGITFEAGSIGFLIDGEPHYLLADD